MPGGGEGWRGDVSGRGRLSTAAHPGPSPTTTDPAPHPPPPTPAPRPPPPTPGAPKPKRWWRRTEQQVTASIQESFAPLLQRCSQLAAGGDEADRRVRELLDDAHE